MENNIIVGITLANKKTKWERLNEDGVVESFPKDPGFTAIVQTGTAVVARIMRIRDVNGFTGSSAVTGPTDINAYLAEFEDIPGTRVFTAARARAGYHLNQFAMSLMKPENRDLWRADERAYTAPNPQRVLRNVQPAI